MNTNANVVLQTLASRVHSDDDHGHKARVQFLRVAMKQGLHDDIRLGCIQDVFEEDLDACLNHADSIEVIEQVAEYGKKEGFFDTLRDIFSEKWAAFNASRNENFNPAQLCLF